MELSISRPDILRRAVETWGREAQLMCAAEECAELIGAICKHVNRDKPDTDIIGEAADVFIMLSQIALMTDAAAIQYQIDSKLQRLASRLEA